ncbi:MAG: M28 family peptidase [bacterium]|nr:MAG: M28 family peptidase [bacterium]
MTQKKYFFYILIISYLLIASGLLAQNQSREEQLLESLHSISSHTLYDYVAELASEEYEGRLTGTEGYDLAAEWVASYFEEWSIKPGGDDSTYFQHFPIPYTLVFEGCEVCLHIPYKKSTLKKYYRYEYEFIPGSTSGSGEITTEVIYVGYGITAPELNYDDYKDVDVKGKIVLMEREVPVSPDKDAELFKKWRPYSFHQYKLKNAVKHGAKGMLYNYGPIGNPNNGYDENFIYSHVGDSVVADIFAGTGRTHADGVKKIKEKLKPQSFNTKKVVTIRNITEHHPEGIGSNVIGILEGNDPDFKNEVIIIGGHLDHLGRCYEIMPGANDNASAVAVILAVAEALVKYPEKLKRSIMFICFGAEEQAVVGSKFYLENPKFPLEKTICLINMDGVGCGDKLRALAAENFPTLEIFSKSQCSIRSLHH